MGDEIDTPIGDCITRVLLWSVAALAAVAALVVGALLLSSNDDSDTTPAAVSVKATNGFLPPPPDGTLAYTDAGSVEQVACDRRAQQAQVTYQPARAMTVDQQEQVAVVVTIDPSVAVSLPGDDPTLTVDAEFSCTIQARIISGPSFQVAPEGTQTRTFASDDTVRFDWIVTPTKTGSSVLGLEVQAVADPGYTKFALNPQQFTASIKVQAEPRSATTKIHDWSAAVVEFPLVRGAGVLAAALVAWKSILRFRRTPEAEE